MPKQDEQITQQIKAWLNDRLFYRPDLQIPFKRLHKHGADLEYIEGVKT